MAPNADKNLVTDYADLAPCPATAWPGPCLELASIILAVINLTTILRMDMRLAVMACDAETLFLKKSDAGKKSSKAPAVGGIPRSPISSS